MYCSMCGKRLEKGEFCERNVLLVFDRSTGGDFESTPIFGNLCAECAEKYQKENGICHTTVGGKNERKKGGKSHVDM